MKSIERLRIEPHGLFLDLSKDGGKVGISQRSGDIRLDEGPGDDCFHGAVIFPHSFDRLEVTELEQGGAEIILYYGGSSWHSLGISSNVAAANRWVELANDLIGSRKCPPQAVLVKS